MVSCESSIRQRNEFLTRQHVLGLLGLLGLRVSKDEQAGFKAEERDMVSGRHDNL